MKKLEPTLERAITREEPELAVIKGGTDHPQDRADSIDLRIPALAYTQTRILRIRPEVLERNRVITPTDTGPVIAAYKLLRTRLLQIMDRNDWCALGVTSPGPGEGKTLTSINLAISLALDVNHTVLLVDVDLRRPAVHRYFDLEGGPGLADYLTGNCDLRGLLFNPGVERLVVLPGGAPIENSSELLTSPRMVELAREMKARYRSRIVLFDLPPLFADDDVLAFSPRLDAVLLVAEEGRTKRTELEAAAAMLGEVPVLGPVVNKARVKARGY